MKQIQCPKCKTWLKLKLPRKNQKGLKGAMMICCCGHKAECIDWNPYISRWKEIK